MWRRWLSFVALVSFVAVAAEAARSYIVFRGSLMETTSIFLLRAHLLQQYRLLSNYGASLMCPVAELFCNSVFHTLFFIVEVVFIATTRAYFFLYIRHPTNLVQLGGTGSLSLSIVAVVSVLCCALCCFCVAVSLLCCCSRCSFSFSRCCCCCVCCPAFFPLLLSRLCSSISIDRWRWFPA